MLRTSKVKILSFWVFLAFAQFNKIIFNFVMFEICYNLWKML